MSWVQFAASAAVLLLVTGATTVHGQDATGHDSYQTFAFHDESEAPRPKVISQAILGALEAKGYKRTHPTQADFLVVYWAGVSAEVVVAREELDFDVRREWDAVLTEVYPVGSLVIGLVDNTSDVLLWANVGSAVLDRRPTQDEVNEIATAIFRELPVIK